MTLLQLLHLSQQKGACLLLEGPLHWPTATAQL
jgi:hypothetical protein